MDFLHQNLQRAPANLAQVSIVVRKELLVATSAVDMNASPSQVAVGLAEAAIAIEGRFRSHRNISAMKCHPRNKKAESPYHERPA
jgi:hypothetical protein